MKNALILKKITLLLLYSLAASFTIRILGTAFPATFKIPYLPQAAILIYTFFIVIQLLFWIIFLVQYASNRPLALKLGAVLAIIGTALAAAIHLKNLGLVFKIDTTLLYLLNSRMDALFPLASSLCHLIMFVIFKKMQTLEEVAWLNRPIFSALIGLTIFIAIQLLVLTNSFYMHSYSGLEHLPRALALATMPFMALAAVLIFYFYLSFYTFLGSND